MSGARLRRAAALAALALLARGAAAAGSSAPATLEGLMDGMARTRGVLAEFREEKQLALLSAPIVSRGVLYFIPPDRMVRKTSEPAASTLVVDGPRVSFRDAAGTPIDLSAEPSAREFVDNFTLIFRGDLAALRAKYEVRFESQPPRWRLVLQPRDALLQRFVRSLTLSGEGEAMREMVLEERDGDRTSTRFERVDADHAYSAAEIAALFGAQ